MNRSLRVALSLLLALFLAGCFEIEQSLDLKKDLSGTAGFRIGIDFEPMVTIMTVIKREMEGKEGPPTAEELAEARKEFLEQSSGEEETGTPSPEERAAIDASLPDGVRVGDMSVERMGLGIRTGFVFLFDQLSKLSELELPSKEGEGPDQKTVIKKPFEGLAVVDDGKTILITAALQDPRDSVEDEAKQGPGEIDPETEAMMRDAFKGLKISYRINAPFDVIETNATRRDGTTLFWEYDLAALEKLEKSGAKGIPGISVKYRR